LIKQQYDGHGNEHSHDSAEIQGTI